MRILVTGGAGFIGSSLVDRLVREGHRVTIIDDFNGFYDPSIKRGNIADVADQIEVIEGNICDASVVNETFRKGIFECVIHLAARAGVRPSINDPAAYISTNIDGTYRLLEAAKETGVRRFLFASSSSVYGVNKKVPFAEADPIHRTISPYAATKIAAEQLCSTFAHLYGIETACLRFFTVYGPRQRPDLAISKFVRLIIDGQPIDRYGDGVSGGRDYTYIDDITSGVMGAVHLEGLSYDTFNLGGNQVVTLNELIATIEAALGKRAEIRDLPPQPGDVPITYADITKSMNHLGYSPSTSIKEGVPKFVDWYLSRANRA
jgi:UDP-glucuronate 4-epimerase